MIKLLVIDNYDSFTYNLVAYCQELGADTTVVYNDCINISDIKKLNPDKILLSPGPGTPADSGICLDLINNFHKTKPILGVCLGHQCIGQYFGGEIIHAAKPMHGKTSVINIINNKNYKNILFNNIKNNKNNKTNKNNLTVTRYHSLIINNNSFPDDLIITAVAQDNNISEIMAIQHQIYPIYGVQFHPEAVLSEYGHEILNNFLNI